MPNKTGKGGFQERKHQINRKGRPKNAKSFNKYIRAFLSETVEDKPEWSRLYLLMRQMATSKHPADRKELLDRAFGKVKDELDINVKDIDAAIAGQLARVAGRSEAEDAGAAEGHASSSGHADTGTAD